MGYPHNFKIATRQLTKNILLASTAFSVFNVINLGARMAVFKFSTTGAPVNSAEADASETAPASGKAVIWSPLPYSPQVLDVLKDFLGASSEADLDIAYIIVPDREHNLNASKYKEKFPHVKIIGPEKIKKVELDITFTEKEGNKLISGGSLAQLVDGDRVIVDNFEFVYLPHHFNSELVMFEKSSRAIFEADLLMNLGVNEPLEQFSPATGYAETYNPHAWFSYLTRYMQPYSKVGNYILNKVVNRTKSQRGLEAIAAWAFDTIVVCHGNIITKDAKGAFKHALLS
ncbi:uncharacterized protein LODBEIA_P34950 [Lodderomyces beijingensis]|uniref:Uncharacterized protein n=1 Tax=Lodderomyces beijingensis TaxID=1775926 RepID=A0ABP0ZQR6_9ASCO